MLSTVRRFLENSSLNSASAFAIVRAFSSTRMPSKTNRWSLLKRDAMTSKPPWRMTSLQPKAPASSLINNEVSRLWTSRTTLPCSINWGAGGGKEAVGNIADLGVKRRVLAILISMSTALLKVHSFEFFLKKYLNNIVSVFSFLRVWGCESIFVLRRRRKESTWNSWLEVAREAYVIIFFYWSPRWQQSRSCKTILPVTYPLKSWRNMLQYMSANVALCKKKIRVIRWDLEKLDNNPFSPTALSSNAKSMLISWLCNYHGVSKPFGCADLPGWSSNANAPKRISTLASNHPNQLDT